MIRLEIGNKEFKIANSYEELSLGQYIDIIKLSEAKIKLESTAADVKIITLLSDNPTELEPLLWDLNMEDFNELTESFNWIADNTILESFKNMKPLQFIDIDDNKYGILSDFNKLSLGEMISFETLMKQEQSDLHRLDLAFGLLLRPMVDGKIVKFSQEVFDKVIEIKYKVKMIDIYAVIAFFLSGEKKYTTNNTKGFSIQHQ